MKVIFLLNLVSDDMDCCRVVVSDYEQVLWNDVCFLWSGQALPAWCQWKCNKTPSACRSSSHRHLYQTAPHRINNVSVLASSSYFVLVICQFDVIRRLFNGELVTTSLSGAGSKPLCRGSGSMAAHHNSRYSVIQCLGYIGYVVPMDDIMRTAVTMHIQQ